jgi:hypothetical protein
MLRALRRAINGPLFTVSYYRLYRVLHSGQAVGFRHDRRGFLSRSPFRGPKLEACFTVDAGGLLERMR